MKVIIPENISEITLSQYQKYHNLNQRKDLEVHEYNRRAIGIFTNLSYNKVKNIKVSDYEELIRLISKALLVEAPFINIFTLKGVEYGFIPNFDEITQGEFVDMETYQDGVENLHKLMAVLFRKVISKDTFGNYDIEPYNGTKDRSKLFLDMPMNVVHGALSFFLNLSKELEKATQKSIIQELQKVQGHKDILKNGDGMLV